MLPARTGLCSLRACPGQQQRVVKVQAKGKKAAKQQQPGLKVSPRGKVSSRPSQEQVQALLQQQQQQQQQAATSAAPGDAQEPQPQQQQQQQQAASPVPGAPAAARRGTETPQVVVDGMFQRVVTFAGLPVLSGILLFPVFWYFKVVQKLEYPIWVVYLSSALTFGGGLLGITYGILSTSWDPARPGSFWGWTELQANLPILLNRDKQNK